ncbi:MAG: hypothetical protein Q8O67_05770 [Deltaproteobacteria bacterium]|nr:hypothetical protein [Deltaproteobacteria bacterium]
MSKLAVDDDDRCFIDPVTAFPVCSRGIVGAPATAVTAVDVVNGRACALTGEVAEDAVADPPIIGSPGGELVCWGAVDSTNGPPGGRSVGPWAFVTVGPRHVCVSSRVDDDAGTAGGDITCFGNDEFGQATPLTDRFNALASVDDVTCGVRTIATDRGVGCWGDDRFGGPVTSPFLKQDIELGDTIGCVLDQFQGVTCFGALTTTIPGSVQGSFGVGDDYACGISNGGLSCIGNTRYPIR